MTVLSDAVQRYGAVAAGLLVGTAAKYGLALNDGKKVTPRVLIADALLLGLLGLIAVVASDWAGLTGNAKVLAGAMTAVSSDRLVRLLRRKFEQRVQAELDQLPASKLARLIGGDVQPLPEDARELLKRADEAEPPTTV